MKESWKISHPWNRLSIRLQIKTDPTASLSCNQLEKLCTRYEIIFIRRPEDLPDLRRSEQARQLFNSCTSGAQTRVVQRQ